ncbi:AraC family transcriptional regulator [Paenibacillus sp. SAF-054]|uniref:AraC family transcriptional regulator n=1 Tax=unclassified Paenibacillus TaxID=185978 RepID=UPI003F7E0C66
MSVNQLLQALRLNYLFAERYSFSRKWTYSESAIPYSMIRFIEQGCAKFTVDDTEYVAEENDIVYIPQGSSLACEALSDDLIFISIRFTAAFPLSDNEVWSGIMGFDTKFKCGDPYIRHYFHSIVHERDSAGKGKNFMLRGYLELIVGYLINSVEPGAERTGRLKRVPKDNKNDNRVEIILDFMMNHISANLTVEEMGQMVNLSVSSLRRLFKQHTGKSPREFLIDLKMVVAAKKIIESDERISDIAYYVGIEDPNYFSRLFKRHYKVTPQAYRQLARD